MEEYFEGLHLIDFEQLKIENNVKKYNLLLFKFQSKFFILSFFIRH